jgi:hypothetical protein
MEQDTISGRRAETESTRRRPLHSAGQAATAKREEQIVALRLSGHTFGAIATAVGVTPAAAQKSFTGALARNANKDLETYHRTELAALDLQYAEIWRLDAPENQNKVRRLLSCQGRLIRIHVRRARLLGLDAPRMLNVQAIYKDRRRTKSRSSS